jgi:hypothetical protein
MDAAAEFVVETSSPEITPEHEAPAVPAPTEDSTSDITTKEEIVSTHEVEVEEAQKAEPEHVAEKPSSIPSHSSDSETLDVADAPAADKAVISEQPAIEMENSKAPFVTDKPHVVDDAEALSKDTAHPILEHEAESAHSEPAAQQTAEASPDASSEAEKEESSS